MEIVEFRAKIKPILTIIKYKEVIWHGYYRHNFAGKDG